MPRKIKSSQKNRSAWRKATLVLWGKLIRDRDKYCQWCRGSNRITAHHIIARGITPGNKLAWFDLNNGVTLCYRCHIHRLKAMPDEYIIFRDDWMLKRGLNYQKMRIKYNTICKLPLCDIKLIYGDLKKQCEEKGLI